MDAESVLAYGIQLVQPGAAYLTNVSSGIPKYKRGGFGLTFTKLTPRAAGYDVEAQITRYDKTNFARVLSTEKFTGTVSASEKEVGLLFTLSGSAENRDLAPEKPALKAGAKTPAAAGDKLVLALLLDLNGQGSSAASTRQLAGNRLGEVVLGDLDILGARAGSLDWIIRSVPKGLPLDGQFALAKYFKE